MKKILFVTNIPSPYRVDFFNELGKYCDLTVSFEGRVATDRNENWSHSEESNFNAVYFDGIRIASDKYISFGIRKLLKQKWDNIVLCGYATPTAMYASLYLSLHKIPFSLEVDGGFVKEESKVAYKIKKYFISKASYWFSTGKATTEYLVYYGAKKDRCFEYPFSSVKESSINEKSYSARQSLKKEYRNELGLTGEKIILFVGQFIYRKGVDVLLKSATMLDSSYSIYIMGGTPSEEYIDLQKQCSEAKIYFVDFQKSEMVEKYMIASDVFVLPTREDIWGLVVNEAISKGLPVVTTNKCIAGLELVNDKECGVIVNTDSPKELAEAILTVCDSKTAAYMSENAIAVAKNYTIETMAKTHDEVFKRLSGK